MKIDLIETGTFGLDGGAMFGVVPRVLWEKTNPPDSKNRILMALRVLVIRTEGRTILVDSGIGQKWDAGFEDRYAIDHSKATLLNSLRERNISPTDVTDIVLTHLHFDHVGGVTSREPGGKVVLTFPKASIHVQKANLTHAHAPTAKDRASFQRETIDPILNSPLLKVHEGDFKLADGVEILVTHGHTPGHQLVKVIHPDGNILFTGDTIPTASHIPIPYVMAYDLYPLTTMEEKRRLLTQARDEHWRLVFPHDPYTPAAYVDGEGDKFKKSAETPVFRKGTASFS